MLSNTRILILTTFPHLSALHSHSDHFLGLPESLWGLETLQTNFKLNVPVLKKQIYRTVFYFTHIDLYVSAFHSIFKVMIMNCQSKDF